MAAVGNILTLLDSLALFIKNSSNSGLSITGIVFGNVTIEVTPPEAAAILADLKLSLCLSPGSQI